MNARDRKHFEINFLNFEHFHFFIPGYLWYFIGKVGKSPNCSCIIKNLYKIFGVNICATPMQLPSQRRAN